MLALLLAAEEGEEKESSLLDIPVIPDPSEVFWGLVFFGGLYALIKFVLLPPVQRVMNDRAATIQADKDAASAARAQAVSASAEVEDQLAGVREQAQAVIDQARAEAETERQTLVGQAEREVAAMKEIAENEIAADREAALAALQPQVADLAVGAASKVMDRPVDAGRARPIIDYYLNNPN